MGKKTVRAGCVDDDDDEYDDEHEYDNDDGLIEPILIDVSLLSISTGIERINGF